MSVSDRLACTQASNCPANLLTHASCEIKYSFHREQGSYNWNTQLATWLEERSHWSVGH